LYPLHEVHKVKPGLFILMGWKSQQVSFLYLLPTLQMQS